MTTHTAGCPRSRLCFLKLFDDQSKCFTQKNKKQKQKPLIQKEKTLQTTPLFDLDQSGRCDGLGQTIWGGVGGGQEGTYSWSEVFDGGCCLCVDAADGCGAWRGCRAPSLCLCVWGNPPTPPPLGLCLLLIGSNAAALIV